MDMVFPVKETYKHTEYTPEQIRENRLKWINLLETTDLPQARNQMKSEDGGFCCLGLCAAHVLGLEVHVIDNDVYELDTDKSPNNHSNYWKVDDFLEIDRNCRTGCETITRGKIINWNDAEELSFKEIAARARTAWGL